MSIRPAENSTLDIRHVIGIGTPKAVDLWLDVVTELPDRARELGSLSKAELGKLGPLLDGTNAVELFESIDDKLAAEALHAMDPSLAATFLEALDSDHAANILREFKEPKREALLTLLPLERAMVLRGLLSWPEDCAAAHMVPETLTVRPNMTVSQAVASVRERASGLRSDARTTAYVYVTDADSHLLGVIAFRALVLANPEQRVRELMGDDLIVVSPLTDKELAAQTIMGHNLMAVPVVDADNRLLGIIAEDEAIDIAEEEATEDAERQGGSAPLEVPYLRASPWLLWAQAGRLAPGTFCCRGLHRQRPAGVLRRNGGGDSARVLHPTADRHRRQHRHPDRHHSGPRDGHRSGPVSRCACGVSQGAVNRCAGRPHYGRRRGGARLDIGRGPAGDPDGRADGGRHRGVVVAGGCRPSAAAEEVAHRPGHRFGADDRHHR